MNCDQARDQLSPFLDDELSNPDREAVERHLEACASCRTEIDRMRRLGDVARRLGAESPPDHVWHAIDRELRPPRPAAPPSTTRRPNFAFTRLITAAAVLLAAVGLTWLIFFSGRDAHDDHMAVDFDAYLKTFADDPSGAQQVILAHYNHQAVDLVQATELLKYPPAATATLAGDYTLDSAYVLDMPCCRCILTNYSKDGRTEFALFEHDADQPIWFGDRPAISAQCCGVETRVVQFDGLLAASWPRGERHLTLIGAKDMDEVVELIETLNESR